MAATIIDHLTEYTQSLGEYFVETFKHLGGTIVNEDTYTMGDMQINAQIQRLQGSRPTAGRHLPLHQHARLRHDDPRPARGRIQRR